MNILIVNGQNHKGSTYHLGRMLAEKVASPEEIQEIFLPRDMSSFCCGCTTCIIKDERLCPHIEQMRPITEKIDSADLLIFTTPVYVYHATASLKALLDHYAYRWMVHRPEEKMFSKQAVCLSTAAGGGMKSACKDIEDSMFFWGVAKTYSYGVAVQASAWERVREEKRKKIEKKITALSKKILKDSRKPSPSLKTKLFFLFMRNMQKNDWNPADKIYWQEKGWTGKNRPWKCKSDKR